MNPFQRAVREFHEAMGESPPPKIPGLYKGELRAKLIAEEARETVEAIEKGDFIGAIDGLSDLAYVVFGAAETFGINLAPFFEEVHRSNMTKVGSERRADGKITKGPNYRPPNLEKVLEEQKRKRPMLELLWSWIRGIDWENGLLPCKRCGQLGAEHYQLTKCWRFKS